jgi:hypothetical protein
MTIPSIPISLHEYNGWAILHKKEPVRPVGVLFTPAGGFGPFMGKAVYNALTREFEPPNL